MSREAPLESFQAEGGAAAVEFRARWSEHGTRRRAGHAGAQLCDMSRAGAQRRGPAAAHGAPDGAAKEAGMWHIGKLCFVVLQPE